MWSHIKSWFGSDAVTPSAEGEKPVVSEQPGEPARRSAPPEGGVPSITASDLERDFVGSLLGVGSFVDAKLNNFERKVLRSIESLASSDMKASTLVPRLPSVVPQLLRSFHDDDGSSRQLAEVIGRDVILVGEVVRLANSPFYRTRNEISSLQQAVVMLGQNGIRQLVANISMKPIFDLRRGHFCPLAAPRLWQQSERCAIATACLAKDRGLDEFHAYLAGICFNIGLIIGAKLLDKHFDGTQSPHSNEFRVRWLKNTRRVAVGVASQWEFPAAVVAAVEAQVTKDNPADMSPLAAVLYAGDKMALLRVLVEEGRYDDTPERFTRRLPAQLGQSCTRCYEELRRFDV